MALADPTLPMYHPDGDWLVAGSPTANPGSLANVSTTGTGPGDPGYGQPDANVDLADLLYFVNEWQTGLVECP